MYDPTLEILALPTAPKFTFEVISEDAIQDQYLAWRDQSYGFLMNVLTSGSSEVEIEAARLILLGKVWNFQYSRTLHTTYAYVEQDGQLWARLYKEDLQRDYYLMVTRGEAAVAQQLASLISQIKTITFARRSVEAKAS